MFSSAKRGLKRTILKALLSNMMFWIEPASRINPHHGHQA
jgi:hypothetical protein